MDMKLALTNLKGLNTMLHLPLLNALKTFVVAGRYLNFTKAAEELLVSPSAVSHQIRVLEEYLEVKLFIRQSRALSLTVEGELLHMALIGPFDAIARAIQNVLQYKRRESINIALRPFFSGGWLAPRLNLFWGQYPNIEIDLIHMIKAPEFGCDDIDLAILWGKGEWPGMEVKFLLPGNLTPICSAELLEREGRPTSPAELSRFILIHDEDRSVWDAWFNKAGVGNVSSKGKLVIDDTNVRVQSIQNSQGIMLGCPLLLKPHLESGRLVQLFDICLDSYNYYLVYPKNQILSDSLTTFIDWLLAVEE